MWKIRLTVIGQQGHPFPASWERQTVRVSGWIAGPVADKSRRQRFPFRVERLRGPDGEWRPYRGTLWLSWYESVPQELAYGQRWQLSVRVRRPRGFRNPGGPEPAARNRRQSPAPGPGEPSPVDPDSGGGGRP